jgi:hypothetical protein
MPLERSIVTPSKGRVYTYWYSYQSRRELNSLSQGLNPLSQGPMCNSFMRVYRPLHDQHEAAFVNFTHTFLILPASQL